MVLLLKEEEQNRPMRTRRQSFGVKRLLVLTTLSLLLFVLIINVYVFTFSRKFILENATKTPFLESDGNVSVAIVLGASVYSDGTLSPLLEDRAKTALELYKNGVVQKLLVSGDNRASSYNEVIPIREYIIAHSVPEEDVFTDFAGFNTYDSMYRAKKIFGAKNVLIVTQSFHLPRAVYAARQIGLNAYGVPANKSGYYFRNNAREVLATTKTFIRVLTQARPLFLGREISIEGDGRDSLR